MSSRGRPNRGVAFTLRECWIRAATRWSRGRDAEVPRGVSRKARQQMVRIRMAKRSPAGRKAQRSKLSSLGETACRGFSTRRPSGAMEDAEDYDAAVALKVKKRGLLGVFQRRVPSDVVFVPTGQTCVICMESFKPGEVLEILLCQHIYHARCIDRWLGANTWCCVCKADVEEMARNGGQPPRPRYSRSRSETINTRCEGRLEGTRTRPGYTAQNARSTPLTTPPARPAPIDATRRDVRLLGRDRQTIYGTYPSSPPYMPYRPRAMSSPSRGSRSITALNSMSGPDARVMDIYPKSPDVARLRSSGVNFNANPPGVGMLSPRARALTPPLIVSHMSVCTPDRSITRSGRRKDRSCNGGSGSCRSSSSDSDSSDSIAISSSRSSSSSCVVRMCNSDDEEDETDIGRTTHSENAPRLRSFTQTASLTDSPRPSRVGSQNPGYRAKSLGRVLSLQRMFLGTPSAPAYGQPRDSQPAAQLTRGDSSGSQRNRALVSRSRTVSLTAPTLAVPERAGAKAFWSRSSSMPAVSHSTLGRDRERPRAGSRADSPGPGSGPSASQAVRSGAPAVRHLSSTDTTQATSQRLMRASRLDPELQTSTHHGRSTTTARRSRRHWDSPEREFTRHLPSSGNSLGARAWGAESMERGRGRRTCQEECKTGVTLSARARVCVESTFPTAAQLSLRSLPSGRLNNCLSPEGTESWLDNFVKSPSSEADSESASCSTQWSETLSQVSECSDSTKTHEKEDCMASGFSSRARTSRERTSRVRTSRARTFSNHTTSPEPRRRSTRARNRARTSRSKSEGPRSRSTSARLIWDDDVML